MSGFSRLEKNHVWLGFFLGKFTPFFCLDSTVILILIYMIFAMWSSNTYSRCLLSRRSQLQALNDCSSYTVVGWLHTATAALMAARRTALLMAFS